MGLYLQIEGITPDGAVTMEKVGDLDKLIRIDSANISRANALYLEVGNMADITGGNMGFSELSVSRTADPVTSQLTTWFYKQVQDPKLVKMVVTRAGGGTVGDIPVYMAEMDGCFITSQNFSVGFDGDLQESLSLVYQSISEVFYTRESDGSFKKGAAVKYDLAKNTMVSGAK